MIIKVQDDNLNDRFLVEAAYIRWVEPNEEEACYVILEIYIVASHSKKVGSVAVYDTAIEEHPSLRLRIYDGDRVFIMNDEGKTIDAKRITIGAESKREEREHKLQVRGYTKCTQCGWAMGEKDGKPMCPKCKK